MSKSIVYTLYSVRKYLSNLHSIKSTALRAFLGGVFFQLLRAHLRSEGGEGPAGEGGADFDLSPSDARGCEERAVRRGGRDPVRAAGACDHETLKSGRRLFSTPKFQN